MVPDSRKAATSKRAAVEHSRISQHAWRPLSSCIDVPQIVGNPIVIS